MCLWRSYKPKSRVESRYWSANVSNIMMITIIIIYVKNELAEGTGRCIGMTCIESCRNSNWIDSRSNQNGLDFIARNRKILKLMYLRYSLYSWNRIFSDCTEYFFHETHLETSECFRTKRAGMNFHKKNGLRLFQATETTSFELTITRHLLLPHEYSSCHSSFTDIDIPITILSRKNHNSNNNTRNSRVYVCVYGKPMSVASQSRLNIQCLFMGFWRLHTHMSYTTYTL